MAKRPHLAAAKESTRDTATLDEAETLIALLKAQGKTNKAAATVLLLAFATMVATGRQKDGREDLIEALPEMVNQMIGMVEKHYSDDPVH